MIQIDNSIITTDLSDVNTKLQSESLESETLESFIKHRSKIDKKYKLIAEKYNDSNYLYRAQKTSECGNFLEFAQYQKSGLKLTNANFCKDRLCSMCAWRRSLKTFAKLAKIVSSEQYQKTKYQSIFLTLTLESCEPYELHESLNHLFYSFDKFLKNKRIKKMSRGYFRGLEITYNKDKQLFHHHIHIIFCVNSSYFTNSNLYIKQSEFTTIWEKSADLYYKPRVHIEKVRGMGGIAEISKYAVKADDELLKNISLQNLKILRDELSNRRLVGMGGIFRKISNLLKLNLSDENMTSDDISIDDLKDDILIAILRYKWNIGLGSYRLVEKENVGF